MNIRSHTDTGVAVAKDSYVDYAGAEQLTGLRRKRIHALSKDAAIGFPKPVKVGRSVRWSVLELLAWLSAQKDIDSVAGSQKMRLPVCQYGTPERRFVRMLNFGHSQPKPKPTLAEVKAQNEKANSVRLLPGMRRSGRLIETAEGERVFAVRVSGMPEPEQRQKITVPIRKKTTVVGHSADASEEQLSAGNRSADPVALFAKNFLDSGDLFTPQRLREHYESGETVDQICARFRIGKTRALRILKEAGTLMRAPGRKPRAA